MEGSQIVVLVALIGLVAWLVSRAGAPPTSQVSPAPQRPEEPASDPGAARAAATRDPPRETPAAAPLPPTRPPPKEIHVRVVDAGAMRFVDMRRVDRADFIPPGPLASVGETLKPLGPIACTCFVLPASVAGLLAELEDAAQALFWPRFLDAAAGTQFVSVYVDGPPVDARSHRWAEQTTIALTLDWPEIHGTDPATGRARTWRGDEILGAA